MRRLDAASAAPLQGTDGATYPFWSPDSSMIGYFTQSRLYKVSVSGGAPLVIADVINGRGGVWSQQGTIRFNGGETGPGLWRVSEDGGETMQVTRSGLQPWSFLPDGQRFLFGAGGQIHVGSLQGEEPVSLLPGNAKAVYVPSGHILYKRAQVLFAQPFNPNTLSLTGDPIRIADNVADETAFGGFSVSTNGVLAYRTGTQSLDNLALAWIDDRGAPVGAVPETGSYRSVELDVAQPQLPLPSGRRSGAGEPRDKRRSIINFPQRLFDV